MDAVFNEAEKAPPDVVQVPQGYVVFQLLAIRPPATPTFEEIRSRVESEFKNERAGFLLQQKTQELSDRAKAGHDLKKAAKDLGATVKTSDLVLPDGQVPDIGSMSSASAIFSLKPGEISGPITAGGNGVVAQLLEKQAPTDQEFAEKKDGIRQSLLEAQAERIVRTVCYEPAQGHGKVQPAQGQSGRDEKPDAQVARKVRREKFSVPSSQFSVESVRTRPTLSIGN